MRSVFNKHAAAPEMGDAQYTTIASSTGDGGREHARTNDNPANTVAAAFSEQQKQLLNNPHNEAHPFPVGAQQSAVIKRAAEDWAEKLLASSPVPVRTDAAMAAHAPAFGKDDSGAFIAHDPAAPNAWPGLAHEMGHADVDKTLLGQLGHSRAADLLMKAAPLVGGVQGALGASWPKTLATAGLMSAPRVGAELAADYHGYQRLKHLGADDATLAEYLKSIALPQASYLMPAALSVAANRIGNYAMSPLQAGMQGASKLAKHKLERRIKFRGLDISVETDTGSTREWYDPHANKRGTTTMKYPYGYIRKTLGTDGDHVDVYVGPDEDAAYVYVVNQMKTPDFKVFDEQKCMLGFGNATAAKQAYLDHYNDSRFFGSMKRMAFEDFKEKVLAKDNHGEKVASAYAKHTALNLGQAARDIRYMHNHPHADKVAPEGTPHHVAASIVARVPSLASNLWYAALPPSLHHTEAELSGVDTGTLKDWFLHGYKPWEYADPAADREPPAEEPASNKTAATHSHTKTLPDGRIIDVVKLWDLTKDLPSHEMDLSSSKATTGISRSSNTGFGAKRLSDADLSHPILVHGSLLLDGRHRVAKATDAGWKTVHAKEVPKHMIEQAVIKQAVIKQASETWKPDPRVAKEVKHSVESFLASKNMPKDTPYALLAGAAMYFHGLRPELKDADIVVQGLGKQKFNEVHGKYEVDGGGNIDDLGRGLTKHTLDTRHEFHGVHFASLPATLAFKKALNRDKDQHDIQRIETLLKNDELKKPKDHASQRFDERSTLDKSHLKTLRDALTAADQSKLPKAFVVPMADGTKSVIARVPNGPTALTLKTVLTARMKTDLPSVMLSQLHAVKKAGLSDARILDLGEFKQTPERGLPEAQIDRGAAIEKEHTARPGIARQIAVDHLNERPDYYSLLERHVENAPSTSTNKQATLLDYLNKRASDFSAFSPSNTANRGPGPTHNQVPGDFLGLPMSQPGGYRRIVGGHPETPDDSIERTFRFHDEPTDTYTMDGNTAAQPSGPAI